MKTLKAFLFRGVSVLLALAFVGGCSASSENKATDQSQDIQSSALSECLSGQPIGSGSKLNISSTVAPITSMIANVAGGLANITGIVPEGTNSHTFEPAPKVAATLAGSDVLFANGLVLEEPTKELAEVNLPASAALCELGTAVLPVDEYIYDFSFPEDEGKPNPHLWTDPKLAIKYVALIRDVLVKMDPSNADAYVKNAAAYTVKLNQLDAAVVTASATLPAEDRLLLTYHDAYAYFAADYGWQVLGAIQPSNFDEPTSREVADLIVQVRDSKVKAIFGSEVFPSTVLEQIGRETGVSYIDVLRDDDLLGEPGDTEHSFLGLMQFNYVTMVEALGGDATVIRNLDISDVTPDTANYPQ
ncbi:MAG: metal ABC transporter substrate-binding protein [Acidimicrobiales bacterium]